jgi:hypothetical protein
MHNQRTFMNWLGTKLGFGNMNDWYFVKHSDFQDYGGRFLLNQYYGASIYACLSSIYNEYEWLPWKFKEINMKEIKNMRVLLDFISERLNCKYPEDWYQISINDAEIVADTKILSEYNKIIS